jgi:hypothetical protein
VNLEIAQAVSQRRLSPSTAFHAGRECVETSGDVIKICYVIRALCQGTLVDSEHSPTEIVRGKIEDFFAGDVRLYGESFSYRTSLIIDRNEGFIYALKLARCPR